MSVVKLNSGPGVSTPAASDEGSGMGMFLLAVGLAALAFFGLRHLANRDKPKQPETEEGNVEEVK